MNIRTALLYKKNLATLLEESVRPTPVISSGNCADRLYKGRRESTPVRTRIRFCRRSASKRTRTCVLLCVRVLGQVQVHEVRSPLL